MTILDQTKYIGWDKLNALDRINLKLLGSFQITGSISLLAHGVLKRKSGDIDIVVNSLERIKDVFSARRYNMQEWFDYEDELENPKDCFQGKGKVTNRLSFDIDGVKVCAFFAKDQKYKVFEFMNDRHFKVSNPEYLIKAKKKYVSDLIEKDSLTFFQNEKLKKHVSDIYQWNKINEKR